jgi:hypothetical protein
MDSPAHTEQLEKASKTYKYLRLGLVGAATLIVVSVVIERWRTEADCFQTSISAYYYTPAREIFVGGLLSIGLALFVIKGRTDWEDAWLNLAGMCAPLVALVPTTDVGTCFSVKSPLGDVRPDNIPKWLSSSVHNNLLALLLFFGVAWVFAILSRAAPIKPSGGRAPFAGVLLSVAIGIVVVVGVFNTRWALQHLHGPSAVLMFIYLWAAVLCNWPRKEGVGMAGRNRWFGRIYKGVAFAMPVLGVVSFFLFGEHRVFAIEVVEIACFVVFWGAQTYDPQTSLPVHLSSPGSQTPVDDTGTSD